MKKIRIAMMAAAMALCVTSVAKAQDAGAQQQGGRRGGGRGGMQVLLKDITLTDAQKAQFDSISKAYSDKNADLMTAARGGDADARSKMMANREQQTKDIEAILTADQKTVFEKNVADMAAARQAGGRPPFAL